MIIPQIKWAWCSIQYITRAAVPRYPSMWEIKHLFEESLPIEESELGVEVGARNLTVWKKDVDGCDLKREGEAVSLSFQLDSARQLGCWQHVPCPLPQSSPRAGRLVPRALTGAGKEQVMLELKAKARFFFFFQFVGSQHVDDSWVSWIRPLTLLMEPKAVYGIPPLEVTIKRKEWATGKMGNVILGPLGFWFWMFLPTECGPALHWLVYLH